MVTADPSPEFAEAAKALQGLGLVEVQPQTYVLCANPKDRDFPPRNRHCRGRVYVDRVLDEGGHEYRCPECERPVFPSRGKQRHPELRTRVSRPGVHAFVNARLMNLGVNVKQLADGVFKVDLDGMGVVVCIADHCADERYLTREWAARTPTCYIVVNPKDLAERFLKEDWLTAVPLAGIAAGEVDIEETVRQVSEAGPPAAMLTASIPVYTKGARPIVAQPVTPSQPGRRFVVEVGPTEVRVEGETVIAPQAGPRLEIFRALWERFLADCAEGCTVDEFRPFELDDLAGELEARVGKEFADIETVRRTVNRMQTDIEKAVKQRLGMAIDRDDIIQTVRRTGHGKGPNGYRINPSTVAIRPYQADLR
ncbi:MAG: hypothetical protein HZA24_00575 [Nitrospirae bacterium]|nr:hypothetical protein [Nitrospirota bacterium]